jgi:hypothetical protein
VPGTGRVSRGNDPWNKHVLRRALVMDEDNIKGKVTAVKTHHLF